MIPVDPDLPQLAVALDPERMLPLLQVPDLPEPAQSCRIRYIRYKPQTNCIVLYQLRQPSGNQVWVYAKLFASDRQPRTSDKQLLSKYYPEQRIAVSVFPRDLQMPALRLADLPDQAPALLKGAVARSKQQRFDRHWGTWVPVRYKPERRCVMRGLYEKHDSHTDTTRIRDSYARFYASSQAERFAGWYQYFEGLEKAKIRTPGFIGYSKKNRLLLLKKIAGSPLRSFFDRSRVELGQAIEAASRSLAAWHRLSPPSDVTVAADVAGKLRSHARTLEMVAPEWLVSPTELADSLTANTPTPGPSCLLHGDFYYDQVLIRRKRSARFLDLDNLAFGDPIIDLASFCAQLRLLAARGKLDEQRAEWICARFISGYESASESRVATHKLNWHISARLIELSIWPFRLFEDNWPKQVHSVVSEALAWERRALC